MPASLPARANLEFLRKQSKDLRKAFAAGDPGAGERIRNYLPRAGRLSDDELRTMDLSLQEAQHALACEYGFSKWEELVAAVEPPRFEDLARLTDREIQILMREVDQVDLVRALIDAPEPVAERFLANVSERVRQFIRTEMEFESDVDAADFETSRRRLLENLLELREQGWVTWPPRPESPEAAATPAPVPQDPRLARVGIPLTEVSLDELAGVVLALAEQARRAGILSLERHVDGGRGTLLTEGIRLTVDGTEPPLVTDLLETRAATILRSRTIRGRMAIEGWMSIRSGDNPYIVALKMSSCFDDEPEHEATPRRSPRADELAAVLHQQRLGGMSLRDIVELYRDLAFLARQQGLEALAPLVELVDDPVLAGGMRLCVHDGPGAEPVLVAMEQQLHQERAALHGRHCLVIKGIAGIQAGQKPETLAAEAREWAEQQAADLGLQGADTGDHVRDLS